MGPYRNGQWCWVASLGWSIARSLGVTREENHAAPLGKACPPLSDFEKRSPCFLLMKECRLTLKPRLAPLSPPVLSSARCRFRLYWLLTLVAAL